MTCSAAPRTPSAEAELRSRARTHHVRLQMEKEQSLQQLLSQGSPRFQEEQESSLLRLTHPWPAVPSLAGVPGVPGVPGALGVPGVLGVAGGKGEGCGKEAREGEGSLPLSRPLKSLPWSPSAQPSSLPWLGLGGEGSGSEEREGGGSNLALPRPLGPLPWTPEEDAELLAFVETYGARHWRRVPKMTRLPRDPQTCRLRWLNHLCFQVSKLPFSAEEDALLLRTVSWSGETKWATIAAHKFPKRSGFQIQQRWHFLMEKQEGQRSAAKAQAKATAAAAAAAAAATATATASAAGAHARPKAQAHAQSQAQSEAQTQGGARAHDRVPAKAQGGGGRQQGYQSQHHTTSTSTAAAPEANAAAAPRPPTPSALSIPLALIPFQAPGLSSHLLHSALSTSPYPSDPLPIPQSPFDRSGRSSQGPLSSLTIPLAQNPFESLSANPMESPAGIPFGPPGPSSHLLHSALLELLRRLPEASAGTQASQGPQLPRGRQGSQGQGESHGTRDPGAQGPLTGTLPAAAAEGLAHGVPEVVPGTPSADDTGKGPRGGSVSFKEGTRPEQRGELASSRQGTAFPTCSASGAPSGVPGGVPTKGGTKVGTSLPSTRHCTRGKGVPSFPASAAPGHRSMPKAVTSSTGSGVPSSAPTKVGSHAPSKGRSGARSKASGTVVSSVPSKVRHTEASTVSKTVPSPVLGKQGGAEPMSLDLNLSLGLCGSPSREAIEAQTGRVTLSGAPTASAPTDAPAPVAAAPTHAAASAAAAVFADRRRGEQQQQKAQQQALVQTQMGLSVSPSISEDDERPLSAPAPASASAKRKRERARWDSPSGRATGGERHQDGAGGGGQALTEQGKASSEGALQGMLSSFLEHLGPTSRKHKGDETQAPAPGEENKSHSASPTFFAYF